MIAGAQHSPATPPIAWELDESWLDRAKAVLVEIDGSIGRFRLTEPATGVSCLVARTDWASEDGCKRLQHEFSLKDLLAATWGVVPTAYIRSQQGPVLAYGISAGLSLAGFGQSRPSLADFLRIAYSAAAAVASMHREKILHCDLKPANLFMSDDHTIRLMSFGFAHNLSLGDRSDVSRMHSRNLAYTPPEQVRPEHPYLDVRSDLYSLGVTLFELLTGSLPLKGASTAEWLHAHVAVAPERPSSLRANAPNVVDALILKLLAKDPLDRYQSAETLSQDLLRCLQEWTEKASISSFELGRVDRLLRLAQPTSLFGRSDETKRLNQIYSRSARTGTTEIALLAGPAGSGKSILVRHFASAIRCKSTIVASGKSDQYQPATPYGPLVQALRSLALGLLGGPYAELQEKRALLATYLGPLSQIVLNLVPEMEFVIGQTCAARESPTAQAPLQVHRALLATFRAFSTEGRPLLLILDDIHWADDATLDFVEAVAQGSPENMVLIAAYRSQEETRTVRFVRFLREFRNGKGCYSGLKLFPLKADAFVNLIAETMDEQQERVVGLAHVLHRKAAGNPFHVTQLLRNLVDERVIEYDARSGQWTWDVKAVERHGESYNVVDLLIIRLARLSPETLAILRPLSAIGATADASLLSRVAGASDEEIRNVLNAAVSAGLLLTNGHSWTFSHDRIQEAVYALTPLADRPSQHAHIAAAMLDLRCSDLPSEAFQIAAQIELSAGATLDPSLTLKFAHGLVSAAERAIGAAARERAMSFLDTAGGLLGEDRWILSYTLARQISVLRIECLLATADLEVAQHEIERLFERMSNPIDRASAHRLKSALQTVRSDFRGATETAISGLSLLGIHIPLEPNAEQLSIAYEAVKRELRGRRISQIADLPKMNNETIEAAMELLTALEATMFYPSNGLMFLHLAEMVRLTLEYGVAPASVQGLAWFGVSIAHTYDAPTEGLEYTETALELVERHGYERYRTATLVALDQVSVWTRPMKYALARAREAKAAGNHSAELRWLCYSCNHIVSDLLVMGEELPSVQKEIDALLQIAHDVAYQDIEDLVSTQSDFVGALRGVTNGTVGRWEHRNLNCPSDSKTSAAPMSALFFWTYVLRGEAAFLLRDLPTAGRALEQARELTWTTPAHINLADCELYSALVLTQTTDKGAEDQTVRQVSNHRQRLASWADRNPVTFRNKSLLLEAEIARLEARDLVAMRLFDQSASAAALEGFVHEQALAYELAARHAEALGLGSASRHNFQKAVSCYRRWGASGKLAQLEAEFPLLSTYIGQIDDMPTVRDQSSLDFAIAMTTAQALSEEIELDRLVEVLMRSMVVHAGAQYALLMLMHDGQPRIEASARLVGNEVSIETDSAEPTDNEIPLSILFTAIRTQRPVAFGNASVDGMPLHAASLTVHPVRSLLCLPLIKQGNMVGVLYLENNLVNEVFTPKKVSILEVLAPQAANTLETARLYAELKQENARRREVEAALITARTDLAQASHRTVMGEFAASIAHEVSQPISAVIMHVGAGMRWLAQDRLNVGKVTENLQKIEDAARRAAEIVRALRALAKQSPAALHPISIDSLLEEMFSLTEEDMVKNRISLRSDLQTGGLPVLADRTQLKQVILNLINNAMDAMSDIHTARVLLVRSSNDDANVFVTVEDSGTGLSPEIIERIFDPLFTTKESGMGMGLSICRSIMEAHGGALVAANRPDGGSMFTLTLPIDAALNISAAGINDATKNGVSPAVPDLRDLRP